MEGVMNLVQISVSVRNFLLMARRLADFAAQE